MSNKHSKPTLPSAQQITLDDNESSKSPSPSHNMTGKYVALMETNGKECESWYYFIKYEGNEENLKILNDQLNQVEWYVLDDLSVFDLDLEHFVSASTAKEMTKLELNSYAFHRKFDGILQPIKLGFKNKDKNEKKIRKAFDHLSYGQVEDYINDEDLDSEDLTDNESESESESDSDSGSKSECVLKSKSELVSESDFSKKGLPPALLKHRRR
jgi:hypothetical protein